MSLAVIQTFEGLYRRPSERPTTLGCIISRVENELEILVLISSLIQLYLNLITVRQA